ncbi:bifunctional phosphopantothenoylcysteine decarboxylase/phosphopantothenate--cysteine ligase CoaBC [Murdochiella vaginalis]|uniref:bifunctional phosphopantothenoylcysteine decarboxylase/phosphopantothenate--cysteine ligase CoaBC n=1 Tax=Murdochiella vaginalis TaxID=1852373 RepID=UPI0008FEA9E7|nr:bifunctional phosphopantothenoylcysteine decarboxylase/phosphopantothenate--cysteine ligase CoaBC [Murdochiella vaginalis]
MSLSGKRILLGVSGGIAIYKIPDLLSRLRKAGAETRVVMTEGAARFVTPLTFQTMSGHTVYTDLFAEEEGMIPHIDLTREADLFLIAPATANILAKMANGIADDLLSATALAAHCPVLVAPAMNVVMYHNAATQENLETLRSRGISILDPEAGWLACQEEGEGRMPEPVSLLLAVESALTEKDLAGKRILVSAGPTRERLDPVRFLTNDSSGKQGVAIAKRAAMRGADVTLVHGEMKVPVPQGVRAIAVESTEDMLAALEREFPKADALLMAAAPADFRPVEEKTQKIKGADDGKVHILEMVDTPDILRHLATMKTHQTVIGFATESEKVLDHAREKLKKKKLDYIVANDVTKEGAAFDYDTNIVTILGEEKEEALPLLTKEEVADHLLDLLR